MSVKLVLKMNIYLKQKINYSKLVQLWSFWSLQQSAMNTLIRACQSHSAVPALREHLTIPPVLTPVKGCARRGHAC